MRTHWQEDREIFVVALDVNGNETVVLSAREVMNHAAAVVAVASRAAFDAAVIEQADQLGLANGAGFALASKLRKARLPVDHTATAPLRFEPVIDRQARAWVRVSLRTTAVSRWSVAETHTYARTLWTTQQRAEDETTYRQVLIAAMGMEETLAASVVHDIGTLHKF